MKKLILSITAILFCYGSFAKSTTDTTRHYHEAFKELHAMLHEETPLSFKRAVFLSENAYMDNQLSYEAFNNEIRFLVNLAQSIVQSDMVEYDYPDRDVIEKSAAIFKVIKGETEFILPYDTTFLKIKWKPFGYDMEDFWGDRNWAKTFVSKALVTHSGNCHSLPLLYKILAEELDVPAYLSLAPNHTYIKQWSEKSGWFNTELTNGSFPYDKDIKWNSYIKTQAVAKGVYMDTLSAQQSIAYVIADLAQGYTKKFGYQDIETPISWLNVALKHYPNYVNALILKAELEKKEFEKQLSHAGVSGFSEALNNPELEEGLRTLEQSYLGIHKLGYRRMPKEMYLNWLFRTKNDTTRKVHKFETPQPFKEYDYNVHVATAGDGQNYEFYDQDSIARIGTVRINRLTGKIVEFVEYDYSEEMPDEVISRMYDPVLGRFWQVDPLADEREWLSPYNFVQNNPLSRIDPDGAIDYPVVTITKQKTGQTADQRVLGYNDGVTAQVDLYKVVVTDTEDANFRMEFSVTRDAWTVEKGSNVASNVAFEPKDGNVNHFTGKVMPNGYPQGNGTEALKLTQRGSEVVHAESNQTSVNMDYRNTADVAAGVMMHVGGNYERNGENKVAASEGCFGVVNPGNSSSNPSNTYTNNVLNTIQNQAKKSKTNPGHIRVIIEKREGNEYPKTKKID